MDSFWNYEPERYRDPNSGRKLRHLLRFFCCICTLGLLLSGLVSFSSIAATTDPLADFQREQKKLQQEMEALKKQLNTNEQKKKEVASEMMTLDLQIDYYERELELSDKQLAVANTQIADVTRLLAETEEVMAARLEYFKGRLVNIYTTGNISILDVLFSANSFKEFLANYDMIEMVLQQDAQTLEQIKADKKLIEENKVLLEQRRTDLQTLKKGQENSLASLDKMLAEKTRLSEKLKNDEAYMEKAYKELDQTSKEVEEKIRKIQEENARKQMYSGIFHWPIPGYTYCSSDYGPRTHPVTKVVNSFHSGVDFPAPKGTRIEAAANGVVIYSGWLGAYGNAVIIDHGGGISTLYGHMSKITMKLDQEVKAGDKVGEVGTTGSSTGNHLHFEVRKNGAHVNPWTYLK